MREKMIYALGFFDGVHRGHQALLDACREMAREQGCKAGVVTFTSHPDLLTMGKLQKLICTPEERRELLMEQGMADVIELSFDQKMMNLPWQGFFRLLVEEYRAAGLVCGYDFTFGHRGLGNGKLLQEACRQINIPCRIVPAVTEQGVAISSTQIRQLLEDGQMEQAVNLLGHPFSITGTVVPGKQIGRTIGVPTANLVLPDGVVCPRFGVYACMAITEEGAFPAVTNVGTRPTVGGCTVTVEPWLLDYSGDLYGKKLKLQFYRFLRPERKFDSLELLQKEIRANALETRKFFGKS